MYLGLVYKENRVTVAENSDTFNFTANIPFDVSKKERDCRFTNVQTTLFSLVHIRINKHWKELKKT